MRPCRELVAQDAVAALVDFELRGLNDGAADGATVNPVLASTPTGALVMKRSLLFVVSAALQKLSPGTSLRVENALSSAYVCSVTSDTLPDLEKLDAAVRELVSKNLPIAQDCVRQATFFDELHKRGAVETVDLLRTSSTVDVAVDVLDGFRDVRRAVPLAVSTGALKDAMSSFALHALEGGCFLVVWNTASLREEPRLREYYTESKAWARQLGLGSVGAINAAIADGRVKDVVQKTEAFFDRQFVEISTQLWERRDATRMILIAGPSSSGKTTFAKRLEVYLKSRGLQPMVVSVDEYYNPPDKVPVDESGQRDYESIKALNVELLNKNLTELLEGKTTITPHYDMKTHMPLPEDQWSPMTLPQNGIIIIEGIHGLNPELTAAVPDACKFKIAISPLVGLQLDTGAFVSNNQIRLCRRMVRDYLTRGRSAMSTLKQWPVVRRGEVRNIFPNQNNADVVFNSGSVYELHVLKGYVEPLLMAISPTAPEFTEASRLRAILARFATLPPTHVPPQSLLREFIGGSWYYDFGGWYKAY